MFLASLNAFFSSSEGCCVAFIKSSFVPQKELQFRKSILLIFALHRLLLNIVTLRSDQIYADGSTHSFLMVFIFRTTKAVNNEVVSSWSANSRMVDGLAKLRVVTEKGCIHHCCLEYITEGLEHRRVRCAWMSRCKHLFFHPSASETFSCSLSFPLWLYCFFLFSPSICEPFLFFSSHLSFTRSFQSLLCSR